MRVAIAGYGDLTHYICEEFLKSGNELVILTRKFKPQLEKQGIPQAVTDYTSSSLRAPLVDCDALISTISNVSSAYTDIHSTLLLACQESPKCKRFIPAEFAGNIEAYPDQPGFYHTPHEPIRMMLRSQTDVEWTLVCVGWLTDYFVPPTNRYIRNIDECHPISWVDNKIVIPGTGYEPVDFTWARDVVKGLGSLLEAPVGSWEPYTFMSGERSCWNDAISIIQQKFRPGSLIERLSLHKVAEMIKKADDEKTLTLADYFLLSISEACAIPPDKVRAHKENFFPDVNFRSLKDGLSQFDRHPDSIL